MFRRHRRYLGHAATEVALQHTQPAFRRERALDRAQDAFVQAIFRPFPPDQLAVVEKGLAGVTLQALADHRLHIFVQQPGAEQRTHHERHATGGVEMVHVGLAVGINLGQRRRHRGNVGHVLPGQLNPGRLRECGYVQRVVGGAAGSIERHHRVDDGLLVNDLAERHVVASLRSHAGHLACRLAGQLVTQWCVGIDEGRARQVQAHDLHHHLVGIGGAVEGAGAGAVIGEHFRLKQLFPTRLAFGIALANLGLLLVGDA